MSPDGSELYVAHGGLVGSGSMIAVWNAETGEALRNLPSSIGEDYVWSSDGKLVAEIWPGSERKRQDGGKIIMQEHKGGVSVVNTRTGEKEAIAYLEDNRGMHPPWGRIDEPLVRFSRQGSVSAYDRDSGEVLSRFSVSDLTGMEANGHFRFAALDGGGLIAASLAKRVGQTGSRPATMRGANIQGYVVFLDVLNQRELTRTKVGVDCSNAVVAYE